jgi:hypothetical protein
MLVMFALGVGWIGYPSGAFALLGLAWLVRRAAALLARIDRDTVGALGKRVRWELVFDGAIDAGFVLAATWRYLAEPAGAALPVAAFAALVPFGLLRLIPAVFPGRRWSAWFADRFAVAVALFAASLSEVFGLALMAAGLGLLAFALVAAHITPAASDPERPTPP